VNRRARDRVTHRKEEKGVVEAKGWTMDEAAKERAIRQVEQYAHATRADQVFLVVPERPSSWKAPNVVSIEGPVQHLQEGMGEPEHAQKKAPGHRRIVIRKSATSATTVFAAMPFASESDDVFLVSMAAAAERDGVTCVRVDHETFEGDIVAYIKKQIDRCLVRLCVRREAARSPWAERSPPL
jgi:hypothetical protein